MTFGAPIWLYALGGVIPLLVLFYVWSERRMRTRLRSFAASKLAAELTASYSPVRQRIKMGLTLLAVTALFIALARPRYGVVLEESEARGIDLMIALDTSRSMLAEDVKPSRLERSKLAVLDLVNAMQGDRVGLVAFAGDAFLQCPLTLDYDAFRATLEAVDTNIIPRGGTDIATAIREAQRALGEDRNFKLLVLITDGEDLEASGLAAAREAADAGLRIFTVGVGGGQGEPIPIRDATGNPTFLRDASGRIVRSSLDEETLQSIAATSNGIYTPLGATGGGLQAVYQQLIDELPAEELGTRMQEIPLERYQWPLGAAFLLLFLEPLIGTRRRRSSSSSSKTSTLTLLLFVFFGAFALNPTPAQASPVKAMSLYEKGNYAEAAELLKAEIEKTPDDARLHYNLGNAHYRLEQWNDARLEFDRALRTSDPELQADAFFNLGNALYQLGEHTEENTAGREARLARWEEALEAYQNSAALKSSAPDLAQNTELVEQAIAVLARRLTTLADPEEAGNVAPAGRFVAGSEVTLTATANEGWMFREWTDAEVADPKAENTTLTLDEDTVAVAQFVKTWHLEVISADPEHGTADKTGEYPEDEPATVTAKPKEPWVFDFWEAEGAEIEPTDQAQAQVTLTQDATVTAHFAPGYKLEITTEPAIGGYAGNPGYFKQDTEVPIQAEAREGFEWVGWIGQGIDDPTAAQTAILLDDDRAISAHLERQWNLIVAENDRQGGTVTGSGDFPIGTTTPIAATPNEGYHFVEWQGPGVADPTAAETEVTVASARHDVIAVFEADESDDQDQQDQDQQDQDQQDQDQNQDQNDSSDQNQDQQNEDENQNQDSQDQNQSENQDSESQDSGDQSQEQDSESEQDEQEQDQAESEEEESSSGEEEEQNAEEQPVDEQSPESGEQSEEQPGEVRQLGQMTEEEARQLLNVLRESEKKLPAVRRPGSGDDTTGRDW